MSNGGNTNHLKAPWKPGQSGNPNGRPKKALDIAALAKDHSERAMKKLIALIDSEDDKIALSAATHVLDRAIGKPTQTVDLNADVTHHGEEPVSDTIAWVRNVLGNRAVSTPAESLPH